MESSVLLSLSASCFFKDIGRCIIFYLDVPIGMISVFSILIFRPDLF